MHQSKQRSSLLRSNPLPSGPMLSYPRYAAVDTLMTVNIINGSLSQAACPSLCTRHAHPLSCCYSDDERVGFHTTPGLHLSSRTHQVQLLPASLLSECLCIVSPWPLYPSDSLLHIQRACWRRRHFVVAAAGHSWSVRCRRRQKIPGAPPPTA